MREAALTEKVAKDSRWPNMYLDQEPLPQVDRNLDANSTYCQ